MIAIAVAAAIGAFALPSQAAPKTATLFFDNQGKHPAGTCEPNYVLTRSAPSGSPCEDAMVAIEGNGFVAEDTYLSQPSAVGGKLDAKRPLTGTVYIANYPIVSSGANPNQTLGGPSGADLTITVNGVNIGSVSGTGVAAPGGAVAIPVKLRLPARLDGKKVKMIQAVASMTTGVVLTGVSYGADTQSKLVVPTK